MARRGLLILAVSVLLLPVSAEGQVGSGDDLPDVDWRPLEGIDSENCVGLQWKPGHNNNNTYRFSIRYVSGRRAVVDEISATAKRALKLCQNRAISAD